MGLFVDQHLSYPLGPVAGDNKSVAGVNGHGDNFILAVNGVLNYGLYNIDIDKTPHSAHHFIAAGSNN
jgi:hypothetical protein